MSLNIRGRVPFRSSSSIELKRIACDHQGAVLADVQEKSGGDVAGDQAAAAVADEREGDAGDGKQAHDDAEVEDGLGGDEGDDADGDQAAEGFASGGGDFDAGDEEHDVRGQHGDGADQAELLADDGEDHVVL